jgi:HK97 family phage major capsid protein
MPGDTKANLQTLREQRDAFSKTCNALVDGKSGLTAEEQTKFDEASAGWETANNAIKATQRALEMAAASNEAISQRMRTADATGKSLSRDEATNDVASHRAALNSYFKFGYGDLTDLERDALKPTSMSGVRRGDVRNVTPSEGGTAGVLVPTTVMPVAIAKLKAFGGMRNVATQLSTEGGNPLTWGTYDDTASEGEIVAENVTATDNDDIPFGSVTINAWKFSSKVVPISIELLQDSAVDVESIVMDALMMRLARGMNRYFTTGTGTGQPKGIVVAASDSGYTVPTGNTTALAYDFLEELVHSVDPAYRQMPGVGFMFNDSTLKVIKKLKDSNGRPLWLPQTGSSLESKVDPATLLGYNYEINQHVASLAANAKAVLFGAFKKYLIRDVMAMQLFRFTDSVYVKKGQIGFLAWARADGNLIDASNTSVRYLTQPAT